MKMIAVFAKCKVINGKEEEFIKMAHELASKSRNEAANVSYDILKESDKNDNEYYFLEKWNDKAGLDKHMSMDYFKSTIAGVEKIIDGKLEIHVYETI